MFSYCWGFHRVYVGPVADISEINPASVFNVKVIRVSEGSCVCNVPVSSYPSTVSLLDQTLYACGHSLATLTSAMKTGEAWISETSAILPTTTWCDVRRAESSGLFRYRLANLSACDVRSVYQHDSLASFWNVNVTRIVSSKTQNYCVII
jgi:hypothetical protein